MDAEHATSDFPRMENEAIGDHWIPFMVDFIGQLDRPRLEYVSRRDHDVYQGN